MLGLMDTGVYLSCLGAGAAKKYLDSDKFYKKLKSCVKTADGKTQDIVGFIDTKISFKELGYHHFHYT